jgi:hypothetical protein
MAFHTAEYDAYVLLGDPAAQPLWYWSRWQRAMAHLDGVVRSARGPAALRSTQYLPNHGGTVKFGRIGWNERDQQKWTHGSPANETTSGKWTFMSAELWAPSWTQCERDRAAPDVFLSVSNESQGATNPAFNPVVMLAIISELAVRSLPVVADAVAGLREVLNPRLVGFQRRPWGRTVGELGYNGAIQDLHVSGLFKPGRRHERPVDLSLFAGQWEALSAGRPTQ